MSTVTTPPETHGAKRRSRAMFVTLGGGALLLVAAITIQLVFTFREKPQENVKPRIATQLSATLQGWAVTDEALGSTEATSAAALKVLNLDDYVYRRYQRGRTSFTVYAAYWARGKMPTRLVASHTPDRCWTENGMRCVDMRFQQAYDVSGRHLLPAEYRVFLPPKSESDRTYVAYWHTVEGRLYDYGNRFNAVPHPWLWWKDTLAQAMHGSREQLFVRIASDVPLDELWRNGDFQTVMAQVAALGLWDAGE
ncbi:MAG: exosortase-associated EpsI family protein [Verrucomicrobiota bacterium]